MKIEKFKAELEGAIYEGPDGRFYIGGKVVQKVFTEALHQALSMSVVSDLVRDWVEKHQKEAWDKMGDTGNYDYPTEKMNWNEENYWFGYFRALENFESEFLDRNEG